MPESEPELRITLRYRGKDVDDGTMPVQQVATALQGFASAYGKLASRRTPGAQHQLRVTALKSSSFELFLAAWVIQNADQIQALGVLTDWAKGILKSIFAVIGAKRHSEGKSVQVTVNGDNNTVVLTNIQGTQLAMEPEDYRLYEEHAIDQDLDKIVSPLSRDRVDLVEIEAADLKETLRTEVKSDEREFFQVETISTTSTKEDVPVDGHLISLNKESNRGMFRLDDGRSVRYVFVGEDKTRFYEDFAYRGKVRTICSAHFDAGLILARLDIKSVERLQGELFKP